MASLALTNITPNNQSLTIGTNHLIRYDVLCALGRPRKARASGCLLYLGFVSRYYRMGAWKRGASAFDCIRPDNEHDV